MRKISLLLLLAAVVFVSGCYTKAYVREMVRQAQQNQSAQSNTGNTNQVVSQANK